MAKHRDIIKLNHIFSLMERPPKKKCSEIIMSEAVHVFSHYNSSRENDIFHSDKHFKICMMGYRKKFQALKLIISSEMKRVSFLFPII